MRYSILGFSQEIVLSLQKERDGKILKLEVLDLLILKDIADFMNRPNIIKYTIDDKTYFSIQYAIIIEDLPIISIKKQALVDRIDKMVFLGVLEKKVIKNQSGTWVAFRMGEKYEKLLYTCTSSTLQVQKYSTTNHNTNTTNNSYTNKENKDNKLSLQKKEDKFNFLQALIDLGVDEQIAKDWLIVRKDKKATNTQTAFNRIVKEIGHCSITPNECITIAVERSWSGFKAEWLDNLFNKKPYSQIKESIDIDNEQETSNNNLFINGQKYR